MVIPNSAVATPSHDVKEILLPTTMGSFEEWSDVIITMPAWKGRGVTFGDIFTQSFRDPSAESYCRFILGRFTKEVPLNKPWVAHIFGVTRFIESCKKSLRNRAYQQLVELRLHGLSLLSSGDMNQTIFATLIDKFGGWNYLGVCVRYFGVWHVTFWRWKAKAGGCKKGRILCQILVQQVLDVSQQVCV